MLLPLRVLGNSAAKRISSGRAMGPILFSPRDPLGRQQEQRILNARLEQDKDADRLSLEPW